MKITGEKKYTFNRNGHSYYLLGQDKTGENFFLCSPSWDCDWYWGLGYVQSFTNNNNPANARDMASHGHFDYMFFHNGECGFDGFKNMFVKNPFTNDEIWKIIECMKTLYTLRHYSDMLHIGGSHTTTNPAKEAIQNPAEYDRINKTVIPAVWRELEKILGGSNNEY